MTSILVCASFARTKILVIQRLALERAPSHARSADAGFNTVRDATHRRVDVLERRLSVSHGHIGQIDVHGQAGHVPDKEVNRRAALESEAGFHGDKRKSPHEQRRLPAVDLSRGHRDPLAR